MAKAKPKKNPSVAGKKAAAVPQRQKNVLAMKGTDEWKRWLDGYAASKGMPVTVFVDYCIREQAKRDDHPAPPTRV